MRTRDYILGGAVLIVLAGLFVYGPRPGANTGTASGMHTYTNTEYAYSFSYPQLYQVNKYTSEYVTVSDPDKTTDADIVNLHVGISEEETPQTFIEFARAEAMRACAADGPEGSQSCTTLRRYDSFTTQSGIQGEIFYLSLVTRLEAGESEREAGPFWVFDVSDNTQDGKYATLLIYPVHFAEESALYDEGTAIAHIVADSLHIR